MNRIKKILRWPIFWLFLITIGYALSRFINILALPIFTDEAIYVRWAQIGGNDASWRFISLTDGKQPLFVWLMMASQRLVSDPLLAGRLVSVASGWFGLIGMYVLTYEMFKRKRTALFASFLYLISPFALFYDRLAIYDSLVSTIFIWNLYITILLVRKIRLDVALILGLTLGIGMLNKTSAFISLYLLPFSFILFDWKNQQAWMRGIKLIGFMILSATISQAVYSILRLSPYFYIIAQKDTIFVYPFTVWMQHPIEFFFGNITGVTNWVLGYLSLPVTISAFFALFFWKRQFREKLMLFTWFILPIVGLALFGRVLYPRFILFMIMPLLVLSSWTCDWILYRLKNSFFGWICVGCIVLMPMYQSYTILYDIRSSVIPRSERNQYIDDWPSGWGVPQIITFLSEEAKKGKVSIYTEGTFGLLPYAFEIYLVSNPNITIRGIWPVPAQIPDEIRQSAKDHPTYMAMYQNQPPPFEWHLELIAEYPKGKKNNSSMRLYKVTFSE